MQTTSTVLLRMLALMLLALCINPTRAQDYPTRPIRMVTIYSENANSVRERLLGVKLGEQLGVAIIFEAKPGGAGLIAMRDVYRA